MFEGDTDDRRDDIACAIVVDDAARSERPDLYFEVHGPQCFGRRHHMPTRLSLVEGLDRELDALHDGSGYATVTVSCTRVLTEGSTILA